MTWEFSLHYFYSIAGVISSSQSYFSLEFTQYLRALITKPPDNESPKFSTQYEFGSCAKTTPQADVPGEKSYHDLEVVYV